MAERVGPGMNRAEIERRFPGFDVAADIDGQGWWKSTPYETWERAAERALRLLQETRDEFADTSERVAFVMHADIKLLFLQAFHQDALDVPLNTAVSRVQLERQGSCLDDYNLVNHLPADLITS